MFLRRVLTILAAGMMAVSCGGGDGESAQKSGASVFRTALRNAAKGELPTLAPASVSAAASAVDPMDAANQLMDFAEGAYAEYFPSHQVTLIYEPYIYRFYPETGAYLGVRDGDVYVRGGPFGDEIRRVGPLTQFITPIAPQPPVSPAPCTTSAAAFETYVSPAPALGKNAAAIIAGCTGVLGAPQWVQTGGPSVALPSDKTQTISFDPPSSGAYSFQVSFVDPVGTPRTQAVSVVIQSGAIPSTQLTLRASQSVRMGGTVSVRAWPTLQAGDSVQSITWSQVEGPTVQLDTSDSRVALFTVPEVARDTLIRLRATLRTGNGQTDSDEVLVLVERYLQAPASDVNALWSGDHVSRVYAYKPDGPHANALTRCVYEASLKAQGAGFNLCSLAQLPFLAQETGGAIPTVEQVMHRVAVSHDWLGRNFEAFLRTQDPQGDFRRMLNSVTAVVLGTQVRPSFYYAGTGAIYLDAENFWLTADERDTVNEAPDYRSEFGNSLQFATLWRYVQDNQSIFAYFDPQARVTRRVEDLRNEAGWLLYHELGHALDFLPPSQYLSLDNRLGAWQNIAPRYAAYQLASDAVTAAFPLTSTIMSDLGQISFHGETASDEQRAYTPQLVAEFFSIDIATDDYSYSTRQEDLAMTLEEFLMAHRLGIRRDFAITDQFAGDASSSSIIVRWGQRGRIGEAGIKPRTLAIVQQLTPWIDLGEIERLPSPLAMRPGESWSDNLAQPAIPRLAKALAAKPAWVEMWQMRRELRRLNHHAQGGSKKLPPVLVQ